MNNSGRIQFARKTPWFDVRDYGAGIDNSAATNSSAIQSAIDAAELVNGTVFFSPGVFEVDTQLTVDATIQIWGFGATIKQENGANQTAVLKIDYGSGAIDISLFIKVDGNMDNNTTVEGIVLNGIKLSHGLINITATECDIGIVIEGETEANFMFLKAYNCDIGVLERVENSNTPDENTFFISGHANTTHYKKESQDTQITSTLHFACESASGPAVVISGGETIFNGILRGCNSDGIQVTGDNDVGTVHLTFNNLKILGTGNGWGLIVDASNYISGSVNVRAFDGGVWIKKSVFGNLQITARTADTKAAIRLGEGGVSTVSRFTVLPGSYATTNTTPAVWFDSTSYCNVSLQYISADGVDILFDSNSNNDTLQLNGLDSMSITNNSAVDPTIEFYGQGIKTLGNNGTPSVQGSNLWQTGGTITITDFDDGFAGQIIRVLAEHSITITDGINIFLDKNSNPSSVDFNMVDGNTLTLVQKANTYWYELARSGG